MIIQDINDNTITEFKSIISLLKSNDKESVYLGLSLLKEYPYTMMTEFDACTLSSSNKWRYIGYSVEFQNIKRVISTLEEILQDKKYYYLDPTKHKILPIYNNYGMS